MNKIVPVLLYMLVFFSAGCGNDNAKQPESNTTTPAPDSVKTIKHNHDYASNIFNVVDVSQMDMSYYPVEYYKLNTAKQATTPLVARVIYSRPHLKGRSLFDSLPILKYGEPWRLGANESTEVQFFRDVTINQKKIKAGRYILYSIPGEKSWTIVFNSNLDTWGLHQDVSKDLFRFEVPASIVDHHTEYFTMIFEKAANGADLLIAWDNYELKLPIDFSFE